MNWVGVMPYVYKPYFDECTATMAPDFKERILFVDNTVTNVGIMRSENIGVDYMRAAEADWLIILSAAIRFGPEGGLDFVEILEAHPDSYVIHAASSNVKGGMQQSGESGGANEVMGWHLTAFHRTLFDNIGIWDENFTPYGLDDIDLSLRIQKHYKGAPGWETYPCDVHDTKLMGHSLNLGGVQSAYHPRNSYFFRKWGREGGEWEKPA